VSRAKITALVLVNWKGVFYERYLLDPHVTALEGANGAGKTTVMIAAYVALLPDMSKLRFTNLGETAATGGDRGIWGRLGELGRPSYTVLELDAGGERVLAGVRLVRTSEPTVEPTAFVVTKLGADVKLSDLLLVRRDDGDHVPELDEVRSAVERAGGELQTFRAIKDYFAELFERGVTPMRLAGDEERSKLNEMLRTSMTGGISRALTSELRAFLLKEESGLGDTLARMRANLEACARTRSEVAESRRLEREITAIYEAGTEMFAATVHAAREAASEAERDVERARPALDDAARAKRETALAIEQLATRRGIVDAQLAAARAEHATWTAERERARAAQAVAARLDELERELATLTAADHQARSRQVAATAERTAARQERARALEAEVRAAHGLADLQAGLDELVRRAHGFRQLARRLDDARRLTGRAELAADDAGAAIAELADERVRLEAERARLERAGRDVAARRDEHARAMEALHAIDPEATVDDAHPRARAALARLAAREAQAARGQELERERAQAERLAKRQAAARLLAAELFRARATDAPSVAEADRSAPGGPTAGARPRVEAGGAHATVDATGASPAGTTARAVPSRDDLARSSSAEVRGPVVVAMADLGAAAASGGGLVEASEAHAVVSVPIAIEAATSDAPDPDAPVRGGAFAAFASAVGGALFPEVSARAVGAAAGDARDADVGALLGADPATSVVRELEAVEHALRELDARAEARRRDDNAHRQREAELRGRLASLDERVARWQLASATAARLGAAGGVPGTRAAPASATAAPGGVPTTRAELVALRDRLALEQHALGERKAQLEAHRQDLQQRATAVERSGSNLDPELLRLRDELGAELLASRFEDLDVAAASWVEARLGPLTGALIVDDLETAAAAVEASQRTAPTVWLVRAGTTLDVEPPEDIAELADVTDVVSPEPFGARVTRRLPRPSLGRRARERQLHELHEAVARDGAELDHVAERIAVLAAQRRDAEGLDALIDTLALGDPSPERAALTAELAALADAGRTRDDEAAADRERTTALRARLDGLRRLLPDVELLASPAHAERARELAALLADRAVITEELLRLAPHRALLAQHVDVLRTPPPDDATLRERAAQIAALEQRLDAIAVARAALDDVLVHRHAAAYGDAEAALGERESLAPALEAQHASARAAVQAAIDAEAAAEAAWEAATRAAQAAEAARLAVVAHRDRAAAELASLGAIDHAAAVRDLDALAARAEALDREARELVTQAALAGERLERAGQIVEEARARLAAATRDAGPTVAAWTALRDRAQAEGLLHAVLTGPRPERTSIQLTADAWSKRELLLDRVARARGGDELVEAIRAHALDPLGNLATWQVTREWLRRRVPAQVADVDEPLLALERLRDHLDVLEGRLRRQEHDLRGASEDIARGIHVQVRRAHGQVRRLNQQLEGIRFGSIHGIRVEIRRIDRMEQILRALRLGEAQELLFMASIPIEEALDEIFRRYGGGGRAGGQRLLDYREYLELAVEIRRQTSGDWETASPTKLSTGEAIGVGAALMMVVLTEWERDANLLRARTTGGSLRFLFLDEANRLSRDNLGVLFDLCKNLDLQLLIAAPEVARAEGNTTYRLVRHVTDDGREEVIVSGRRALATAIIPADEAPAPGDTADVAEA